MRTRTFVPGTFVLLFLTVSVLTSRGLAGDSRSLPVGLASRPLPTAFEQNFGQAEAGVRYIGRSASGTVFLTDQGLELAGPGSESRQRIRLRLLSAGKAVPRAEGATGGVVNYYRTRERKNWLTGIPLFRRVRYASAYPGIDVVFHGNGGELEYDFEIGPRSSVGQIAIAVDGAETMKVVDDGGLEIHAAGQTWRMLPPSAYQMKQGTKHPVRAQYEITKPNEFRLKVAAYDQESALVIDPVVEYAGVIGVDNSNGVQDIAVDAAGDLVMAGSARTGFPVVNGQSGQGMYVMKLNAAGDTILFSTFIQPSGGGSLAGMQMDASGNLYLAGTSGGVNFPVTTTALGTTDGFLMKLAADGSLIFSALLDGAFPRNLALDAAGNVYLVGAADDTLHVVNAFQSAPQCALCLTTFFAKVNPTATAYVFSSYFFDPANTQTGAPLVPGIAVDAGGNVYLYGQGPAPHVNPWQIGGGLFLAKFTPDGQTLQFSTDLGGGTSAEKPVGMRIGSDGTIFLVGTTQANDYPYTVNAAGHPQIDDTNIKSFATAINPTLTGVVYSSYLFEGEAQGIFLDGNNHLYVVGPDDDRFGLPLQNAIVSETTSFDNGVIAELDAAGNPVKVTQFGGHLTPEAPSRVAVDGAGNIYVAGALSPHNELPQPDPILVGNRFDTFFGATTGTFYAKISPINAPQISLNTAVPPFLFLRNAGSADLHISNLTFSGGRTWGNCGSVVPAGTSCVVTVSDSNGGLAAGTLTITSDAQPAVQAFNIALLPGSIAGQPIGDLLWLDDPPVGAIRDTQTIPFHIWNVGTAASVINLISIGQPASQTNDCGTTLAPGAGCIVNVTFSGPTAFMTVFFDNGAEKFVDFFAPAVNQNPLLSIAAIRFPTQFVGGVSLARTVTVTNTGSDNVTASPSLTGDPEFTIAGTTCPLLLPAGESCVIGVVFTPVINGNRSALLTIGSSTVQLFAQGEISSAVQVSPLQRDFFPTVVHLDSETFPVALTNTLSTAVPITGIAFSLADYTETDNCAGQVPANGSCTVQVKFVPQAVGARNGTMTVNFTGAGTQVLTLTGEGETPFLVAPASLNFSAGVGSASAEQGISIGNRLFATEGYTFTLTGDFVLVQNPCANPLPPDGQNNSGCGPTISFQPKTPGPQQGTFTVSYAGISEQDVVTLNGISSNVSASPLQLNFPLTKITTNSTLDVTLTNSGAAAVGITSVSTAPPYSETDTCQGFVPANGTCILHVAFAPQTATFPVTGTLNIMLADNAQYAVNLSGTGTGPAIGISTPDGTNFADQPVGTSRTDQFAVSIINNGDAPLNIASITMGAGDFTQTNNCPASLVSTCQISVTFKPSAVGLRTGTLTLTDDGFGNPQQIVFTGTGNDFRVNAPSARTTVAAGQTATFNLSYSAVGSFSGQIQVECSGAPQLATCSLSSPNVNVIGSVPVPLTVTVTTSPHTSATALVPPQFVAGIGFWGGLVLLPLALISKRMRKGVRARVAVGITCLAAVLLITSCGGGGSQPTPAPPGPTQGGTPAGTYTLTIASTDQTVNGPVVHQTNLTLVVQ